LKGAVLVDGIGEGEREEERNEEAEVHDLSNQP